MSELGGPDATTEHTINDALAAVLRTTRRRGRQPVSSARETPEFSRTAPNGRHSSRTERSPVGDPRLRSCPRRPSKRRPWSRLGDELKTNAAASSLIRRGPPAARLRMKSGAGARSRSGGDQRLGGRALHRQLTDLLFKMAGAGWIRRRRRPLDLDAVGDRAARGYRGGRYHLVNGVSDAAGCSKTWPRLTRAGSTR